MWHKLWSIIVGVIQRMMGAQTIEQALHIMPVVSDKMQDAIELWDRMYKNEAEWLHEPSIGDPIKIVSLGIPSLIASEKARTATIEMKSVITEPNSIASDKDYQIKENFIPKTRAEYLNKQYQLNLLPQIRRQLEYGIAKGGLVIKPFVYNKTELGFTFCQADDFLPIAFDSTGKMTEAAFVEKIFDKANVYTRIEYHKLNLDTNSVIIINRAFKTIKSNNDNKDELGSEIPLESVSAWKDILPEAQINNVNRLLFSYFRMPEANTIDPSSPLGVSAYSRAVGLIREADLQYSRLVWEYEGGQLAVDVDLDALKTVEVKRDGKTVKEEVPSILQGRLFRKVDLNAEDTYKVFNPSLRDNNYISGLNNILMRIEDTVGLSRGTLSDITRSEAKTATEMLILRQRSYSSNNDIQKALQNALEDAVYIMNVYATLFKLAPEGEISTSYEWDDSLISSPEEELGRRLTLANAGIESKINIRMWYYGETEEQATAQLAKISEEQLRQAQVSAIASGLVQQQQMQLQQQQTGGEPMNNNPQSKVPTSVEDTKKQTNL